MPEPLVSVVVSTYERPAQLGRLLAALRAQTLDRGRFEVVVVDNGSGPATGELLRLEAARGGLDLHVARRDQTLGPSGGRNLGWRAASAPLIAFTDDDCEPEPEWLEVLLAKASEHPNAIIQGRTCPESDAPASGNRLLTRTVSIERLSPQYETCNIAYPRAWLERLGGFDEGFGLRPAGEDTDLAWRAIERGAVTVFAPEAVVRHAVVQLTPGQVIARATQWGECARLFARHPRAREILYRRLFWNVWHYLLVRSLLALASPRRLRPLARLVLARHLAELRARAAEAGAGPAWIPYLVLFDAVETASMLRGAVRHRTLLL